MNLADIEFDRDADFIKHRKIGEGVTYEQDGILFSSGYTPLRVLVKKAPTDMYDDMNPAELRSALRNVGTTAEPKKKKVGVKAPEKEVHSARQRAEDKLAGFRNPENPDYIEKALSENHAAVMAEEHAE